MSPENKELRGTVEFSTAGVRVGEERYEQAQSRSGRFTRVAVVELASLYGVPKLCYGV